jgi:hypothetical protein
VKSGRPRTRGATGTTAAPGDGCAWAYKGSSAPPASAPAIDITTPARDNAFRRDMDWEKIDKVMDESLE